MSRSNMAYLITLVRTIINDPAGTNQVFSDDEIEDYLDMSVQAHMTRTPMSKDVDEKVYYSPYGYLEDGITIYDGPYEDSTVISDSEYTEDLLRGIFTFTSDQDDDYYIKGIAYNIDRAVARCFEQLANDPTKTRSWGSSGGVGLTHNDLLRRAAYYRRLAGAKPTRISRVYDG